MAKKKINAKKQPAKKAKSVPDERPEMPVNEALQTFKVIRKYVSMDGKMRSNLSKEDLEAGQKMIKQLNVKLNK